MTPLDYVNKLNENDRKTAEIEQDSRNAKQDLWGNTKEITFIRFWADNSVVELHGRFTLAQIKTIATIMEADLTSEQRSLCEV